MIKLSITQLEVARKNPAIFAKDLAESTSTGGFFGRPKSVRWLDAVCKFHETNNLTTAANYLVKSFSNRKDTSKNRKEVDQFISSLESYTNEYIKKGYIILSKREPIKSDLTSKLRLSGQIPIINMKAKGGYCAYFFSITSSGWETELKFPIVQNYVATHVLGIDTSEVEVGIFGLDKNKFFLNSFSPTQLSGATKELNSVARIITRAL